MQVRGNGLPDTMSVMLVRESTESATAPPDAVKGPTTPGGSGRSSVRPLVGTGLGMGSLNVTTGPAEVAGVAPVASTVVEADPLMDVFPSAAAADTKEATTLAWVW